MLKFYAANQGTGIVRVVGPIFSAEDYGFVFRLGSDLRKPVDETLLTIREDGTYDQIRRKWFGNDESSASDGQN